MLYYHLKRCNIKRTTCVKDTAAGVAAVTGILSVFCTPTTESTAIDTSTALVAANQASANILRDVANVASCHCKRQKKQAKPRTLAALQVRLHMVLCSKLSLILKRNIDWTRGQCNL